MRAGELSSVAGSPSRHATTSDPAHLVRFRPMKSLLPLARASSALAPILALGIPAAVVAQGLVKDIRPPSTSARSGSPSNFVDLNGVAIFVSAPCL